MPQNRTGKGRRGSPVSVALLIGKRPFLRNKVRGPWNAPFLPLHFQWGNRGFGLVGIHQPLQGVVRSAPGHDELQPRPPSAFVGMGHSVRWTDRAGGTRPNGALLGLGLVRTPRNRPATPAPSTTPQPQAATLRLEHDEPLRRALGCDLVHRKVPGVAPADDLGGGPAWGRGRHCTLGKGAARTNVRCPPTTRINFWLSGNSLSRARIRSVLERRRWGGCANGASIWQQILLA